MNHREGLTRLALAIGVLWMVVWIIVAILDYIQMKESEGWLRSTRMTDSAIWEIKGDVFIAFAGPLVGLCLFRAVTWIWEGFRSTDKASDAQ